MASIRSDLHDRFVFSKKAKPTIKYWITNSVTRSGDFLDFGQLFKALATINLPYGELHLN